MNSIVAEKHGDGEPDRSYRHYGKKEWFCHIQFLDGHCCRQLVQFNTSSATVQTFWKPHFERG
jgi:hypothetical protein